MAAPGLADLTAQDAGGRSRLLSSALDINIWRVLIYLSEVPPGDALGMCVGEGGGPFDKVTSRDREGREQALWVSCGSLGVVG